MDKKDMRASMSHSVVMSTLMSALFACLSRSLTHLPLVTGRRPIMETTPPFSLFPSVLLSICPERVLSPDNPIFGTFCLCPVSKAQITCKS